MRIGQAPPSPLLVAALLLGGVPGPLHFLLRGRPVLCLPSSASLNRLMLWWRGGGGRCCSPVCRCFVAAGLLLLLGLPTFCRGGCLGLVAA